MHRANLNFMPVLDKLEKLPSKSIKKFLISCDARSSTNCLKTYYIQYKTLHRKKYTQNSYITCTICKVTKIGLEKRKYFFDQNALNVIDSRPKAYFLGFMAADGSVFFNKKNNGTSIRLKLKDEDGYILYPLFKSVLGKQLPSVKTVSKRKYFDKRLNRWRTDGVQHSLMVSSFTLANDIIGHLKYSRYEQKTFCCQLPTFNNDELFFEFFRGVLDGDGWIANTNYTDFVVTITGASLLLPQLCKRLKKYNIQSNIHGLKLNINGRNAINLLRMIYGTVDYKRDVVLKRKYKLYKYWNNVYTQLDAGKISSVAGRNTTK